MTTDRELLELAARASGLVIASGLQEKRDALGIACAGLATHDKTWWNPLTDDGDALRLAVKLCLSVEIRGHAVFVDRPLYVIADTIAETSTPDPYAATRRAIVRAAAEIGRGMA